MTVGKERVVFISHRHVDKHIADFLSTFLEDCAPGRLKIYQSSNSANAPRIGRHLGDELRQQLREAGVVVWLYTAGDADWHYCIWECAIATDSEETRLAILQFDGEAPAPFQDLVRVNVQDQNDCRKLLNNFYTQTDFFPDLDEALAPSYHPDDQRILSKADLLYEGLRQYVPQGNVDEWPAWGYLIVEISPEDVLRIKGEDDPETRQTLTRDVLTNNAAIVGGDQTAKGLFGSRFPSDIAFSVIFNEWRRRYANADTTWLDSVAAQISLSAMGFFPTTDWAVMQGANPGEWSIPIVNWIRTLPTKSMQFDIYFLPIRNVDERTGSLDLGIVPARTVTS